MAIWLICARTLAFLQICLPSVYRRFPSDQGELRTRLRTRPRSAMFGKTYKFGEDDMPRRAVIWAVPCAMLCMTGFAAAQDNVSAFYKGKTLDMIVSSGVGGGQDANARLIARHWPRHIPGAPGMVVKNMPGAGHLRAANFMANQAPKDGTVIAALVPSFVLSQVLQTSKGIQFDAAAFNWIGASAAINSTFYVWSTSPVKSMEDATRRETLMGATGAGSYTMIYPRS